MSQENLEMVKRFWDAWEQRDIDAVFALYDPAVVWVQHSGSPIEMHGTYVGHDGIRQVWREWLESFRAIEVCADTFIDAGDSVIVGWQMTGQGKASAAPTDLRGWSVHTLRRGSLIRVDVFETKAEALRILGLSE